jgi:hypothetical protein
MENFAAYLQSKYFFSFWIGYILFMSYHFYESRINEYRVSIKQKAEVVDRLRTTVRTKAVGRSTVIWYPQFQMTYEDSVYIFADHDFWARSYTTGETATVIFLPDKPKDAVVYNFLRYWISLPVLIVSFVLSLFFFIIPVIINWNRIERQKERGIK